jgi:ribosomal protein RSM22 (predicted rRNA methylase)
MVKAIGDFPMKTLMESGKVFDRYIKGRKAPIEEANLMQKMREVEELVLSDPVKYKLPKLPAEGDDIAMKQFISRKNQKVKEIVKQKVYIWQAINYDDHKARIYLVGRSAQEYATIMKIFREIQRRDSSFSPNSFFDFGSGVGTGTWAASEMWKKTIFEYYLVDSSASMNNLSDLILRDGDVNKKMFLRNVYHRQFLPGRNDRYDVVLCAYSLFEMPSVKNRLEIINNLWNKTGKYLIFIETGTNAGFSLINEARDFLMQLNKRSNDEAFVFSPCTHESPCPRYELSDGTPCNFEMSYKPLPFAGNLSEMKHHYSYLVIKKGQPNESDRWPRIVRPTMLRHKHVICRMCTSEGKIQEGIFTSKKQGKLVYRCAKISNWGDQFPLTIKKPDESGSDESDDEKS